MLPPEFQQQMQAQLGTAYPAFEEALRAKAPVSIRLNPAKPCTGLVQPDWQKIPWHPDGFYLPERPVFTLDPLFHAGAYYVQEASSMFLGEALRQSVDFSKKIKALDLCAAPGGKSTLLASMLSKESLLVANEVIRSRTAPLRENIEKWGHPNIAVASEDVEVWGGLRHFFDVIVVDAPCSGEGMFRKDPNAVGEWSPANVGICVGRQRRIVTAAAEALAPDGVLAYSTCTFNRHENEENCAWFASELGLKPIPLRVNADWGISETDGGYRFFPHQLRGEGFFIQLFKKESDSAKQKNNLPTVFKNIKPLSRNLIPEMSPWLKEASRFKFFQTLTGEVIAFPAALEPEYLLLDKYLKSKWFGIFAGEFKGNGFIPGHSLALCNEISETVPRVNLNLEQILRYLKKENFDFPADTTKGWVLASYKNLPLGWIKVIPNRINNYFPSERRIRMDISGVF